MSDQSAPRSRRAILGAAVASGVAVVAAAFGRPRAAAAADSDYVRVGQTHTGSLPTYIEVLGGNSAITALVAGTNGAIVGSHWAGLYGGTAVGSGVRGTSNSTGGRGVLGTSSGTGVRGESDGTASAFGVYGYASAYSTSVQSVGTYGHSKSSGGVGTYGYADSASGTTYGAFGHTVSPTGIGVYGAADGSGTGILGRSGPGSLTTSKAKTGVYGEANQDAASRGVWGRSNDGQGVRGDSAFGIGVYGNSSGGWALSTSGRVKFARASGSATIAAGQTSILVIPQLEITSASLVFLQATTDPGSRRIFYTKDSANNTVTIRISSAPPAPVVVNYLILG